jgi:poly(A) polymerase
MQMTKRDVQRLVYQLDNDMVRSLLLLAAARDNTRENFEELYHAATAFRAPRFPLVGEDVLNLGWKEGPDVGRILSEMSTWWMDKDFRPGRTECLAKLLENYPLNPEKRPAWITKKD